MNACNMADRIRLIIDTDERLRRAVHIAAARQGASPSEVVNALIAKFLQTDLALADAALAEENGAAEDAPTRDPVPPRPKRKARAASVRGPP